MTRKKIAIIGLGYVGLPLANAFSKKFKVIGYDNNLKKVKELKNGIDKTNQFDIQKLKSFLNRVKLTNSFEEISGCNVYIVTVPTPVTNLKKPDLSYLLDATKMVGTVLKHGDIIIYESTVYPGCTEEDCVPLLEAISGLKYNQDFFCGYSPERINPGDKINTLTNIVKVTSGSTPKIAELVDSLYNEIIEVGTFKATSIRVAEASKAIENAQRDINISFMNELALIFDKMDIDTTDVLEAASTKWNFIPFKPGLVGGHCISVDPYFLAHKAVKLGYTPEVILSGRNVNDSIPAFIVRKVLKLMQKKEILIKGARALILGITFKENLNDIRNSKVPEIYKGLVNQGLEVDVYFYAINPTEVLVNIVRHFNTLFMFLNLGILIYNIKNKNRLLSLAIMSILTIEVYAVLAQALDMFNDGAINPGQLKGVTANRNITAFSIAIKIPYVLYLIISNQKLWTKISYSCLVLLSLFSLSMIQSRASFVASGLIGVYDDFYNADFKLKFFLQIVVAKILIDQGFIIDHFHGLLGLQEIPRIASQIFTVFVFLVIVNAINFIDGIDGMAITEVIKVILLVEFFSTTHTPIYFLGILIILSCLPLYYLNFKKENKVFLGDAGSLLFGTLIAVYLFHVLGTDYTFKEPYQMNKPLFTMSLIIYPLIDLLRVFIIRISNKKSPFSPDKNHIHHRLLNNGYSHFIIVSIIQLTSLIFLALVKIIA